MKCRNCQSDLHQIFVDLGSAPPSNAYLDESPTNQGEVWFPLKVHVCRSCFLVQLDQIQGPNATSPCSKACCDPPSYLWRENARSYAEAMIPKLKLGPQSRVIEIDSSEEGPLRLFAEAGIPCILIGSTASAKPSESLRGIEVRAGDVCQDLAKQLANEGWQADLIIANSILSQTPDLDDFLGGVTRLLKPEGTVTFEFPHFMRLVGQNQFDTINHEHLSYLSLLSASDIMARRGLRVYDAEELATHGGSLRLHVCHKASSHVEQARVGMLREKEKRTGMRSIGFYEGFQERANRAKDNFLAFLIQSKKIGKKVVAYGVASNGNTLLNYTGIRPDLIAFAIDPTPEKHGKLLPGSRIPVRGEDLLREHRPDYVVILPWDLRDEAPRRLEYVREWNGQFVVAFPELHIFQ